MDMGTTGVKTGIVFFQLAFWQDKTDRAAACAECKDLVWVSNSSQTIK